MHRHQQPLVFPVAAWQQPDFVKVGHVFEMVDEGEVSDVGRIEGSAV